MTKLEKYYRNQFTSQIVTGLNWNQINKDFESEVYNVDGEQYRMSLLGSVFSIAPSGKYYMPWCTNQTKLDVYLDGLFYEILDNVAHNNDCFIMNGEGDPCDLFICKAINN